MRVLSFLLALLLLAACGMAQRSCSRRPGIRRTPADTPRTPAGVPAAGDVAPTPAPSASVATQPADLDICAASAIEPQSPLRAHLLAQEGAVREVLIPAGAGRRIRYLVLPFMRRAAIAGKGWQLVTPEAANQLLSTVASQREALGAASSSWPDPNAGLLGCMQAFEALKAPAPRQAIILTEWQPRTVRRADLFDTSFTLQQTGVELWTLAREYQDPPRAAAFYTCDPARVLDGRAERQAAPRCPRFFPTDTSSYAADMRALYAALLENGKSPAS